MTAYLERTDTPPRRNRVSISVAELAKRDTVQRQEQEPVVATLHRETPVATNPQTMVDVLAIEGQKFVKGATIEIVSFT